MRMPAERKPELGPFPGRWERWMDLLERNWYDAMETARGEYAEIRGALQTSRIDSRETRPHKP